MFLEMLPCYLLLHPRLPKLLQNVSIILYRPFQSIKNGVLLIFSFITGDKIEFLPPMMFLNENITGILLSEFYLINFLTLSI